MTTLFHLALSIIMGLFMTASVVMVWLAIQGEQQSPAAGFVIAVGLACWIGAAWMMM